MSCRNTTRDCANLALVPDPLSGSNESHVSSFFLPRSACLLPEMPRRPSFRSGLFGRERLKLNRVSRIRCTSFLIILLLLVLVQVASSLGPLASNSASSDRILTDIPSGTTLFVIPIAAASSFCRNEFPVFFHQVMFGPPGPIRSGHINDDGAAVAGEHTGCNNIRIANERSAGQR